MALSFLFSTVASRQRSLLHTVVYVVDATLSVCLTLSFPILCSQIYSLCLCLCCRSISQLCPALWDPMDCSTPGFPVLHSLQEFAQVHVHWVGDAIWPSHPLPPSSPALNLSQHQGLFQWVSSSHHMAKILELQLQHQSFQRVFSVDFL